MAVKKKASSSKAGSNAAGSAAARGPKRAGAPKQSPDERPGQVFIGTSGWAYASWKPGFYPKELSPKKFLEYYATQLNSVEVNYTFRALPTESMLANWLAASGLVSGGTGFRFSFKAPQRITHMLRLRECAEAVAELAQALKPVEAAGRIGLVLFQLPPNFKADVPRLDDFLAGARDSGLSMAFEFRHESWFRDEAYAVLRRHGAALCVAESDELETPDVQTAPFSCYRFRKSEYSAAQLDALAKTLRRRSQEGEVFAYFKHEDEPTGALRAVEMLRRLGRL